MLAAKVTMVVVSYLLGSVCFGILIAARRGVDLRETGSGNIGATNVGRALGKGTGRIVLALDLLKGLLPLLACRFLFGASDVVTAAAGFAAALGHVLPIWHRFQGGKGAATSAGVLLAVTPVAGLLAVLTFIVAKKISGRASVGSLLGSGIGLIATTLVWWLDAPAELLYPCMMASGLVVIVTIRHRDNIQRLLNGTEPRETEPRETEPRETEPRETELRG